MVMTKRAKGLGRQNKDGEKPKDSAPKTKALQLTKDADTAKLVEPAKPKREIDDIFAQLPKKRKENEPIQVSTDHG
jgi:hypothetical protein